MVMDETMECTVLKASGKICRTCMSVSYDDSMQPLFGLLSEQQGQQKQLSELLEFLINVPVTKNDNLPQQVCKDCQSIICRAANFKNKCLESERTLKSLGKVQCSDESLQLLDLGNSAQGKEDIKLEFSNSSYHYNLCHPYKCSICCVQYPSVHLIEKHVESHQLKINENVENHNNVSSSTICNTDSNIDECDIVKHDVDVHSDMESSIFSQSDKQDSNTLASKGIDNSDKALNNSKMYLCIMCDAIFVKKKKYKHHLQYEHTDIVDVKFDIEKQQLLDYCESNMEGNNLTKDLLPKSNSCKKCNIQFKTIKAYNNHVKRKHAVKIEEDDLSNKWQGDVESSETVLPLYFECLICFRKFMKKKSYELHLSKHKEKSNEVHTCFRCKREFKHRAHLDNHITSVHSSDKGVKCPTCSKNFATEEGLSFHINSHHVEKKHQCKYCDKGFNMLSTLKDHIRIHTGEKPFLCSTCGRGFSQKTNLKEHMRRHQGFKPYKCDNCDQKFVSRGELVAHSRKHSGAHPFVCDHCGSGFTTSSSLVKHKRIHTGEKPYACDLCNMKFAALGTLKNHRRTHTGEKPYQCSYCEKAFVQKNDLVSHIRCHTGERPYVCSTCGQAFRQGSALKTHVKVHLMKELVPLMPLQQERKDNFNKLLSLQGVDTSSLIPTMATSSGNVSG